VSAQVLFTRYERVGLITLNRPEKLNAFADRMRGELADVTRAAAEDDAIGALVITGAGRAFCAGADIGYMHDLVVREEWDALQALVEAGGRGGGGGSWGGGSMGNMRDRVVREEWDALEALVEAGARVVSTIDALHKP